MIALSIETYPETAVINMTHRYKIMNIWRVFSINNNKKRIILTKKSDISIITIIWNN